tara:strand:- start:18 stop:518 length:501 start_codon:yes stop_codon:yes gene_type:complete
MTIIDITDPNSLEMVPEDPVLRRLRTETALLTDPVLSEQLIGLISGGIRVPEACRQLNIDPAQAFRILTRTSEGKEALKRGEDIRVGVIAETVKDQSLDAINVIHEIMMDGHQDAKQRLRAAEMILKNSGTFDDGKGRPIQGMSVTVGSNAKGDFAARLRTITLES